MSAYSVVSFSATVLRLKRFIRARGELGLDIAQTIGPNCSMTHSPGKIEYNCRYFIMSFRTQIHKKKFCKNGFHTLQGTMSHRPLTNTSSLKITAAYWAAYRTAQLHCKKKVSDIPGDVTYQTLSGREKLNYSRPERVW
jgi:hypothetical protein